MEFIQRSDHEGNAGTGHEVKKPFRRAGRPPVPDDTPDEIRDTIGWDPRKPIETSRSDLGIAVAAAPVTKTPPHRLVILGDSISHGFKSFAIADTDLSWPAIVAHNAGFTDFRFPRYPGPDKCPGLPFNLEAAIRELEPAIPGSLIDLVGDAKVLRRLHHLMDEVEDYWERGPGARMVDNISGPVNHNLAIWGWDVRDVQSRTVGWLRAQVRQAKGRRDNFLSQVPSAAGERSALLTLAGGSESDTPVTLARRLGCDGDPGIETLVVELGANNILGTVLAFDIHWSGDGYEDLDRKLAFNAWAPSHFASEYDELMSQVEQIKAQHVIFVTVPHVTIAPMVRGVRDKMPGDRYFARYTRPWIEDEAFSPNRHPCLTGDELRVLDFAVDCYNDHIVRRVREAREQRHLDWRVLDIAGILDRLAYRRYLLDEQAQPPWWTPYVLPEAYLALSPQPDTRFYQSDRFGRHRGGLFALDGVHPTTIGYGIVAREAMRVMADAGVDMARAEPDFDELLGLDTLITRPPRPMTSVLQFVEAANRLADLGQVIRHKVPV